MTWLVTWVNNNNTHMHTHTHTLHLWRCMQRHLKTMRDGSCQHCREATEKCLPITEKVQKPLFFSFCVILVWTAKCISLTHQWFTQISRSPLTDCMRRRTDNSMSYCHGQTGRLLEIPEPNCKERHAALWNVYSQVKTKSYQEKNSFSHAVDFDLAEDCILHTAFGSCLTRVDKLEYLVKRLHTFSSGNLLLKILYR